MTQPAQALADGLAMRLDILDGGQVVPGALDLPAVVVEGTVAHTNSQALSAGDVIRFQALIRIHLPRILAQLSADAQEIALSVKFVLLDLE